MATLKEPFALDRSLNTTEVTPRNIADVLAEELSHITGRNASQVEYDNTDSGLTADNVQDAIDEIAESVPTLPTTDIQTAVDEFETYNGGILDSLKVALSPLQDLHGYAEPWVGGAGKNKFNGEYSYASASVYSAVNPSTVYTLSTKSTGAKQINYQYIYADDSFGGDGKLCDAGATSGSVTITTPSNAKGIEIYAAGTPSQTASIASDTQLELGSTATDYEPYENICPISGHTQVKINNGKNLIGLGTRLDGYAGTTYFETVVGAVGYYFKTSDLPDVVTVSDVGGNRAYISYYNEVPAYGVAFLSKDQSQQTVPKTFTVDKTAEYVHIQLSYGITDVTNIQIEEGSTATAYVPYNGYRVTVNLGGTYYSGTLDVVSGVFTPDTAEKDLSTLTFRTASRNRWLSDSIISEVKHPSSSTLKIKFWSDSYYYTDAQNLYDDQTLIGIAVDNDGNILCRNNDANPPTGHIVYELANPTPIQLSPTMVKALVGENHLSAPLDGQEITESKYKQMFTFDDVIAYIQSLS